MQRTILSAAAWTAAIVGLASPTEGQVRHRSQPATRTVSPTTSGTPILWQPMAAPAPITLAPGTRIAIQQSSYGQNGYCALGKVGALWRQWRLDRYCTTPPPQMPCPWGTSKTASGSCCKWQVKSSSDYAAGVELGALLDLAGTNPSEIYTIQEVGTLAAPVSAASGPVRAILALGQSLLLLNDRRLTQVYATTVNCWGPCPQALELRSGAQLLARWDASPGVLTDQSLRVAILVKVGTHRSDNWGIPAEFLAGLK